MRHTRQHLKFCIPMKDLSFNVPVVMKTEDELNETERALLAEAKQATYRSYAPYSNFSVGAAVLLADGTIVSGSNQENSAYPSGLCAERTALFYANSRYPDTAIDMLCCAARDVHGNFTLRPIAPCGSCRQVLLETETRFGRPIRVMLYGTEGIYFVDRATHLLPVYFDASYLK